VDPWRNSLLERSWSQQGGQPPRLLPYREVARVFLQIPSLNDAAAALCH
jgi:hypothetical protein